MNERIRQLAEQADIHFSKSGTLDAGPNGIAKFVLYADLEKFANLVRADAIAVEREACAKVCEEYDDEYDVHTEQTKQGITDAIRARSNT